MVPRPGAVSMVMVPLCSSITCRTMASPRPVPLPRSLVVKKGSKMWGEHLRRNAGAGVGDLEAEKLPLRPGGHGEGSAAGLHGVVGIEDQVEQHLGELDLVAPEPQVAAGEIGAHLHMGRPGGGGYGEHLAYQLIGGYILEVREVFLRDRSDSRAMISLALREEL